MFESVGDQGQANGEMVITYEQRTGKSRVSAGVQLLTEHVVTIEDLLVN